MSGYSNFGLTRDVFTDQYLKLVDLATAGKLDVAVERFALSDVGAAWAATSQSTAKAVLVIEESDR